MTARARARVFHAVVVVAAGVVLALPAGSQDDTPTPTPSPTPTPTVELPALPTVPYEVVITGPLEPDIRTLLEEVSETRRLVDRPPASIVILRRRATDDEANLLQALRSRGYFAADVRTAVDGRARPAVVTFEVEPGPIYRFDRSEIELLPPMHGFTPPAPDELGLVDGEPAESARVLDAETDLLLRTQRAGHPFAELGPRRAVVDHDRETMEVTLRIQPGARATLAPVRFSGVESVELDFLERRVPWHAGDDYTPERLEEARRAVLDTGLFSTARLVRGEALDEFGRLPVTIEVTERPHRSIGAGLRYRSDEGPGASIFWEHRNLFSRGERLNVELDGSGIGYELGANFRKPDFRRREQDLLAEGSIAYEDTDAYLRRSIGAAIGVERRIRPNMTASLGVGYRALRITQAGERDEFALLSLPATFEWDRSDDLFDPTRGGRLRTEFTPFVDTLGSDVTFAKAQASYSHYLQVTDSPRVVLAGRAAIGFMEGAARANIPADERFYAGGGGSVRGIGFQLASPLDDANRPRGGRSLLEGAIEARVRATETIGFAVFLDAGQAFEQSFPDFSESLQFGAGAGLRYHTPIGPIRFDVAVPLDRRPVDDAFQIYISIGQAF